MLGYLQIPTDCRDSISRAQSGPRPLSVKQHRIFHQPFCKLLRHAHNISERYKSKEEKIAKEEVFVFRAHTRGQSSAGMNSLCRAPSALRHGNDRARFRRFFWPEEGDFAFFSRSRARTAGGESLNVARDGAVATHAQRARERETGGRGGGGPSAAR